MLNKKLHGFLFSLALTSVLPMSSRCMASDEASLSVHPDRCIALRRGQYCYQSVRFRWLTPNSNQYCLYQMNVSQPMICWEGTKLQNYAYEFKQKEDGVFVLKNETTQEVLAQVSISVAWVYKNSEKVSTGWRLF